jgi:hypothetical protein
VRCAVVDIEGLSTSARDAEIVRDAILALDGDPAIRDVVIVGFSKGSVDSLQALVSYPEIEPRIAAIVSLAGAIGGSPLSELTRESAVNLLRKAPEATCELDEGHALDDLRQDRRRQWLADNPLPDSVRYFSVGAFVDRARTSRIIRSTHKKLSSFDPRNDGQLIYYDQIIPGGELLGYLEADHWAVSVPIARRHDGAIAFFANHNDFPREVLLEAIARYVEEQL